MTSVWSMFIQGGVFPSLLFNIALEYAIRRAQLIQNGLKLNGTHQLVVYADFNMLGGIVRTVKENAEALIVDNKETGLEVNADKTKYMDMSRKLQYIDDNSTFERV